MTRGQHWCAGISDPTAPRLIRMLKGEEWTAGTRAAPAMLLTTHFLIFVTQYKVKNKICLGEKKEGKKCEFCHVDHCLKQAGKKMIFLPPLSSCPAVPFSSFNLTGKSLRQYRKQHLSHSWVNKKVNSHVFLRTIGECAAQLNDVKNYQWLQRSVVSPFWKETPLLEVKKDRIMLL